MNLPDIAIINFSDLPDSEVQDTVRVINRQVIEDFMPIWGSGYICKLHASVFDPGTPEEIQNDPAQAEGVIYLVNEASVQGALGYHDLNNAEVPVGFVFTNLPDWTVTLSHEVLELIVDPTVNILVPGPDPRVPNDPNAWLLHTYEVCDAVERSIYSIDGIEVSNFVTPTYFSDGDAPGTRNDFLGVGVNSFGVTPGSHLGTVDPTTWDWVTIFGSEHASEAANTHRAAEFNRKGHRIRPDEKIESLMSAYHAHHPKQCTGLQHLTAFSRSRRKQIAIERRGCK